MVGGSLGLWGERMQFWAGGEFGVVGGADAGLGGGGAPPPPTKKKKKK